MTLNEQARAVLAELGPGCDAIDGIQELADGSWALLMFETRRVDLALDARRGMLVLRTDVGRPPPSRMAEGYAALLSYNLLWEQTGGARMALGGSEGDVVLLMDVPMAGLDWGTLDTVLRNIADVADAWGRQLQQAAPAEPPAGLAWTGRLA
ncbi:MAG TPA: type III secretion system chaperone [Ramlibacter sp.]|nr:type III secretion system chaperone [Ramlibacter sp.]